MFDVDLTRDGEVEMDDLLEFVANWLAGVLNSSERSVPLWAFKCNHRPKILSVDSEKVT